jgi:hypothetical protein
MYVLHDSVSERNSRSDELENVLKMQLKLKQNIKEIVLTGVILGITVKENLK